MVEVGAGVVREEVVVEALAPGVFRVLASPGMVQNMAAGDVVRVGADARHEVLQRSGNVAVQVFASNEVCDEVLDEVVAMGGTLDGRTPGMTVFTLPLMRLGFPRIEAVFKGLEARHPEVEWFFGNVYDPDNDERQLGWWEPDRWNPSQPPRW